MGEAKPLRGTEDDGMKGEDMVAGLVVRAGGRTAFSLRGGGGRGGKVGSWVEYKLGSSEAPAVVVTVAVDEADVLSEKEAAFSGLIPPGVEERVGCEKQKEKEEGEKRNRKKKKISREAGSTPIHSTRIPLLRRGGIRPPVRPQHTRDWGKKG
ncbi:hypothetical protein VTO42DRAFT_2530 [Malbranchea cinnamomea]